MSVSFCLPHPVAVSAFMICRGLCACTEMLWMCVLYVSFGSKVRPRTFGCVAMGRLVISVCMFIVSKALLISSATVIVREGGAIWLNPFATVLFSVCSAVTVECCVLYPCCMACLVCLLLCKEEGSSPVSLQLLRGGIWACMRCPCLCLC